MHRAREALSLWVDGADDAALHPVIHLPARARSTVTRAVNARAHAARAQEEALEALRESINELTLIEGFSTRDVAALLELSPSRVDQLKPQTPRGNATRAPDGGTTRSAARDR
jgi:DNA-directed RNA polymerase specialized sigma24 family protein